MARNVSVKSGSLKYDQTVVVGPHVLHSDEPADIGGRDSGPDPHEFLLSALGTCVTITLQIYAARKQWPLDGVEVLLSHARVLSEGNADSGAAVMMVDRIEMQLSFAGNLSEEQRNKLLDISTRCPIHRMLTSGIQIDTTPVMPGSPAP